MISNYRDKSAIKHILEYCDQIEETNQEYGDSKEQFLANHTYRNALSLCILQIGELSAILSEEFKTQYKEIPWRDIKAMRNIVAHHYGAIDIEMLWNTAHDDIAELKKFCIKVLK